MLARPRSAAARAARACGSSASAGLGEPDPAPVAMKERLAQLTLKATDLRANGRLGDRDSRCGACELPLLGDRHEVRKLVEVHNELLWRP